MRILNLIILSFCLILSIDSFAQTSEEWGNLINTSGRQRMLSQKMAKEFALVLLDIEKDRNTQELSKTIATFEKSLQYLISSSPNDEIATQLYTVKTNWDEYKQALEKVDKASLSII